MLNEIFDRVRRISYQNVETSVFNALGRVIFETVAEDYISLARSVHEQGNFCDPREPVIFLDAVDVIPRPRVIAVRSLCKIIHGFDGFGQEMSRAASIIYDLGIIALNHSSNWQTIPYEARDRDRREELSFVLFEAFVQ